MITIEQYIKHIDNLKEMGVLSEDFHIIQYKDGCLLGVNGKCEAFEDKPLDFKDYVDRRLRLSPSMSSTNAAHCSS